MKSDLDFLSCMYGAEKELMILTTYKKSSTEDLRPLSQWGNGWELISNVFYHELGSI